MLHKMDKTRAKMETKLDLSKLNFKGFFIPQIVKFCMEHLCCISRRLRNDKEAITLDTFVKTT